jgi:hypothetical protein
LMRWVLADPNERMMVGNECETGWPNRSTVGALLVLF